MKGEVVVNGIIHKAHEQAFLMGQWHMQKIYQTMSCFRMSIWGRVYRGRYCETIHK